MIQLLTYSGAENDLKGEHVTINKLHDAQSFDEFDINVIDLRDSNIWRYEDNSNNKINILNDFKSLSITIETIKKSKVLILFPQNIDFCYCNNYQGGYHYFCELKNMLNSVKVILSYLYNDMDLFNVIYEKTRTKINENEILADFYFDDTKGCVLTKSIRSCKTTTIFYNEIFLTTLNIITNDQLMDFLREIKLINDKQEVPEWIRGENMFDDKKQLEIIEENNNHIKEAQNNIDEAMKIIRKNEKYKSILYTSGDELVSVVFEILQDMLGCNLSSFVDDKKEDFHFELNDKIFIGEIKGITSNVKSQNVSQLDVHVQGYLDVHEDKTQDNIVALLIIDHQRNKPLNEREEVHDIQVSLAKRNNSLIIETITLLRMFEKYLNGSFSRDKCIELLIENNGKLEI